MALDPITGSLVGSFLGGGLAGFVRTILRGTKLDPQVSQALDEVTAKLSSLTDALNRHVLEDQRLTARLDELSDAMGRK